VAERKPFLLRIDGEIFELIHQWADDELRSLNGQVEFLLRRELLQAGRLRPTPANPEPPPAPDPSPQ
jgi:hypothetical protein